MKVPKEALILGSFFVLLLFISIVSGWLFFQKNQIQEITQSGRMKRTSSQENLSEIPDQQPSPDNSILLLPQNNSYSFEYLSFQNSSFPMKPRGEVIPEKKYEEGSPFWLVYPRHVEVSLNIPNISEEVIWEPGIEVYPLPEWNQMLKMAFTNNSTEIDELALILNGDNLPEELPFLPVVNAAQVLTAKAEKLQFNDIKGIRYITYFAQSADPIGKEDLIYTFQGMTNDGKYYVIMHYPIVFEDIAEFDIEIDYASEDSYPKYVKKVIDSVNGAASSEFSPSLDQLDNLTTTIKVNSN